MTDRARQAQRFPWGIWLLGSALLLPILTFPIHTDHATFLRGGMTLLQGGTLYVDFVDVKPPLVYMLYAIPAAIAGAGEWGIRLFDVIWQSAALAMLLLALRRADVERAIMGLTVSMYSVLYVTLHFSQTGQVEGLMSLPLATILWAIQAPRSVSRNLLIGFCLSGIILLKYTLGIVAVSLVSYVMLDGRDRRCAASDTLQWAGFSIAGLGLLILPLALRPGFFQGWATVMEYLSIYAGYPPVTLEVVRDWLKLIGAYAGDHVSLLVTLSAAVGAGLSLARRISEPVRGLLLLCIVLFVGLALTVVLERRFSPYQFSRLYLPLSILAGAGLATLYQWVRQRARSASALQRVAVLALLALALIMSPLPRYFSILRLSAMSMTDPVAYRHWLTNRPLAPDHNAIADLLTVLQQRVGPADHAMLMTVEASMIVPFIPGDGPSPYCDSHLYFGYGAQDIWRKGALAEMRRTDWLVVDTQDRHHLVNLHERTSYESLQQDAAFHSLLVERFVQDTVVGPYIVFHQHRQ